MRDRYYQKRIIWRLGLLPVGRASRGLLKVVGSRAGTKTRSPRRSSFPRIGTPAPTRKILPLDIDERTRPNEHRTKVRANSGKISAEGSSMRLTFLGKDTQGGNSPTLWETDDGQLVIQGFTLDAEALGAGWGGARRRGSHPRPEEAHAPSEGG